MLLQGLISWWYSDGYKNFVSKMLNKLGDTADFFSIGSLFSTLFAPYRQISANVKGAFVDRLVSRFVGFFARLGIILVGIVVLLFQFILTMISFVFWPLLPFAPAICIVLCFMGVAVWI